MVFKILVIDDNEDDRFFFKRAVSNSGVSADVVGLSDGNSGLKTIKTTHFDCIFLDYHLPGMNGLDILKEIRALAVDTPVIMLTGQKDNQTIVQLMQAGATDYLSKDSLNPESLRLSIENSQRLYLLKREKLLAEQALMLSENKLAEAQQIANVGNWEYNFHTKSFYFSEETYRILEYIPSYRTPSLKGYIRKIHPEDFSILKQCIQDLKYDPNYDITFRIYSSDNSIKYLNAKGHIVYNSSDKPETIVGTIQDITILKNALNETRKANTQRRATTIVFSIAIMIFLISEAILDPFIDSLATGIIITLSFKGSIALMLKPVERFLEKSMMNKQKKLTLYKPQTRHTAAA